MSFLLLLHHAITGISRFAIFENDLGIFLIEIGAAASKNSQFSTIP
jgi:hypothetical protein